MRVAVELAGRRLLHRRGLTALLMVALAAAGAVLGASSVVAALSQEENIRVRLAELSPAARGLQIQYRTEACPRGARCAGSLDAVVDETFAEFSDVAGDRRRALFWDRVAPADERGTRFVEVDDFSGSVAIVAGRAPRGCSGSVCEAVSFDGGFVDVGQEFRLPSGLRFRVVGRGVLSPPLVPALTDVRSRALAVQPRLPALRAELREKSASLTVAVAILNPGAVHGYSLDRLREDLRQAVVRLERTDRRLSVTAPLAPLDRLSRTGAVARERLLLVAGEGAALILAFAAFAATARRRDMLGFRAQLETLAGSRTQFLIARATEALVPAALGAALSLIVLRLALEVIVRARSLPQAFVGAALPWPTVAAVLALAAVGAVLLFAMLAPARRSRFGVGPLELAAVTALLVIVWQTLTTSALDPQAIARGEGGGPILLLVPALGIFAAGVLLLRLLPPGFRLAERLARGAPFGMRLALLGAARNPVQAAAATTFLAVAVGSALFSFNYRATLEQQAVDSANFEAGAAWRVIERGDFGTDNAAPLTRFADVADETPTPALRLRAIPRETGRLAERELTVLALPSAAIPRVRGWRDDFSTLTASVIAERLSARRARLRGPVLPRDATAVRLWVMGTTAVPRAAEIALLLPGRQFERLELGNVDQRWRLLQAPLPRSLAGAQIVGIGFPPAAGSVGGGTTDEGSVMLGALQVRRGERWDAVGRFDKWTTTPTPGRRSSVYATLFHDAPVASGMRLDLNGAGVPFMRPRSALAQVLPGLLSRQVAALAVDGVVALDVLGRRIRVRAVGQATLFPTIIDTSSRFVVLDFDSLFTALNLERPGVAPPSEAWFFGEQRADFAGALTRPPFRVERAVSVERLQERKRSDPLAAGAASLLLLGGLAGAGLAVLGLVLAVRSDLAAERQLYAEYEALGVPPSTLARSVQYRLATLCGLGLVASVVGAALAVRLTSAFVAVTGEATRPLPPIEPAIAWLTGTVALAAVGVVSVAVAARYASRSFRSATGARLRA